MYCGIWRIVKWIAMRHGRSQAVRLPVNYRFDCDEIYIRKDSETGDMIISKKPGNWDDFFKIIESIDVPDDFMVERDNEIPQDRNLF